MACIWHIKSYLAFINVALRKLLAHYTGWFISGLSELTKIAQGTNSLLALSILRTSATQRQIICILIFSPSLHTTLIKQDLQVPLDENRTPHPRVHDDVNNNLNRPRFSTLNTPSWTNTRSLINFPWRAVSWRGLSDITGPPTLPFTACLFCD